MSCLGVRPTGLWQYSLFTRPAVDIGINDTMVEDKLPMEALNALVKKLFTTIGLTVMRRDRLAEQIPGNYLMSPYLPRIYRQSFGRIFCFQHMFEHICDVPGDIVECGVSIGH